MKIQDYILVHGKIINIKNNVDDKYIWFDISKDEYMKNNPSFFSARISKILSNKYILDTNIEVVVKGIPKGFIDKKGYRQNYIHVTELNGCNLNEDIFEKIIDYDKDDVMLWHGKRCESEPYSDDEINELEQLLREFK